MHIETVQQSQLDQNPQQVEELKTSSSLASSACLKTQQKASTNKAVKTRYTLNQLNSLALEKGYGYKAANLLLLRSLCDQLNTKAKHVEFCVPDFFPLSSKRIKDFLRKELPKLDNFTKDFSRCFKEQELKAFISEKTPLELNSLAKIELIKMQEAILEAFNKKRFFSDAELFCLSRFREKYVIIRSSGKEDSDELANAGGNLSLPFLEKKEKTLRKALAEVIASYFSEKSIKQRLLAKDTSLFTEAPFLPALIQEMILEDEKARDDQVPRSGVILSYEPGKDTSISLIQAAFGSNEGVVWTKLPQRRLCILRPVGIKDLETIALE